MNLDNLQIALNTENALPRLVRRLYYAGRAGLALLLAVGLNMTGFGFMAETAMAYYGDYELSAGNNFTAAMLDFHITDNEVEGYIGLEADGDIDDFSSIVQSHPDSLDIQYNVTAELVDGDPDFCQTLDFDISHQGSDFFDMKKTDYNINANHSILDVTRSTTTDMGTYEFKNIDLSDAAAAFAHGTKCDVDLVFTGWRDGIDTPEESGYTDEERISLRLKNRMVVMNEFLPRPDGEAYGFDFGDDGSDKPQGEWIELYNNSQVPQEVGGWYFKDEADNVVSISAGNTQPATTTVPAKGWLVVYMQKAFLNNDGDTFMLKDADQKIVDKYTYEGSDYCEQEPTPNATNTDASAGDCNSVPPNKSYARIPDGIGAWVDPIPTPGAENTLDQPEDMLALQSEVMGTSTATTTATSSDDTASSTEKTDETASSTATTTATSTDASGSSSGGDGETDKTTQDETAGTSTTATSTDEVQETASSTTATSTDEAATSSDPAGDVQATSSATSTATTTDEQKDDSDDDSAATSSDPIESEEKATSTKKEFDEEEGAEKDDDEEDRPSPEAAERQGDKVGDGDKIDEGEDSKEEAEEPIEKKEKTKEEDGSDPEETDENEDGADDGEQDDEADSGEEDGGEGDNINKDA